MKETRIDFLDDENQKSQVCARILKSLPKWFGIESAIQKYKDEVRTLPFLVASIHKENVGFLSLKIHNPSAAELHVMGVIEKYHRQKIGVHLLARAEFFLKEKNIRYLTVKTLSEAHEDLNYATTRQFYASQGFTPLEEFKTLWGESNPCLFLVKSLA